MDGLWTLADIENLIIPAERDYEEIIAAKIERDATKKLRNETLDLLKRLLTTYIKSELDNEKLKHSLSDINEREAFNEFNAADADHFTVAEVFFVKERSLREDCGGMEWRRCGRV
eukprot:TRINITY_DN7586_c0_g2_i1.p2 TRINITY_DN7586_c0_g2~~TRINITY_DN7586_c0_g2_i1.p2  ORF type:complete len:115 (-),score=24.94 TRINITY_DN7586_c0_g2_i1:119-463(-)